MSLSGIDLNLLLVLHTVLRERNVARAAKRLNVTASAVSNALARLRAALDDPLTIRSGRGIVPTPRAAELEPLLARALGELERAVSTRAFEPAICDRVFTIAVADVGQWVHLPRVVGMLAQEMPRARLRVISIDTLHAAGGLAAGAADVLIGVGEPGPGIHLQPLYQERVLLVARADHPKAQGKVSKKVLATLEHVEVHVSPGKGSRPLAASYGELEISRRIAVFVPTFSAAAAIVSKTDLVASLPGTLLETLAEPLALRAVATPLRPVSATINLLWHERTDADPAMRAFRAVILRA
jgi:DNA-binding transcriptional LysR family regulator